MPHSIIVRGAGRIMINMDGNQVLFVRTALVGFDTMRRYFHEQLTETVAALGEIEREQGAIR